ncbi:unnamed protein product, partial [Heterosigma akashiwo]
SSPATSAPERETIPGNAGDELARPLRPRPLRGDAAPSEHRAPLLCPAPPAQRRRPRARR